MGGREVYRCGCGVGRVVMTGEKACVVRARVGGGLAVCGVGWQGREAEERKNESR